MHTTFAKKRGGYESRPEVVEIVRISYYYYLANIIVLFLIN